MDGGKDARVKGGLTDEAVFTAAEAIVARGQRPTQALVRKYLGRGSYTTIGPALKRWRSAQTKRYQQTEVELPSELEDALKQLGICTWAAAMAAAEAQFTTERRELVKMRDELEAEVQQHRDAVQRLEVEALRYASQIEHLAELAVQEEMMRVEAESKLDAMRAEHSAVVRECQQQIASVRQAFDHLRASHAETVAVLRQKITDLKQLLG